MILNVGNFIIHSDNFIFLLPIILIIFLISWLQKTATILCLVSYVVLVPSSVNELVMQLEQFHSFYLIIMIIFF